MEETKKAPAPCRGFFLPGNRYAPIPFNAKGGKTFTESGTFLLFF
jgi:hypothetical protein